MRACIAWIILACGLLGLAACKGGIGNESDLSSDLAGTNSAELTDNNDRSLNDVDPEETLPPPLIKISNSEPIPTVAQPSIVTQSEENLATPTPEPLLGTTTLADTAIEAQRVGNGAFKVVLVTDRHPALAQIATQLSADPSLVPDNLSVWFITTGQVGDILRSADTSFDACNKNDGIGRPFNSAESLALRNFLADAVFAAIIEAAPINVIHTDACSQNALADRTAHSLLAQSNSNDNEMALIFGPLPSVIGHYTDYLAGEGISSLVIGLNNPEADGNNFRLIRTLLDTLSAEIPADTTWLLNNSINKWTLSADSLIHPIAIVPAQGIFYILDSGRILAIDPSVTDGTFVEILASGSDVEGTRVLELLDLSSDGTTLFALDRAGDIYRFDGSNWALDRYDRPIRDRSAHYYTALGIGFDSQAAGRRHLLESSAPLMLRYADADEKRSTLPATFYPVDISVLNENAYVLLHDQASPKGEIRRIELGEDKGTLRLSHALVQPRQVVATNESLFVLDYGGLQVQQFDRIGGVRVAVYRFVDNRPISAIWADDDALILAGQDALYLLGAGADSRSINTDHLHLANPPNDPALLNQLIHFAIPIGIPRFTQRDYQMAGAPRHYRLGVHEGFDFYWQRGTQVRAAASGTVIKADWDYVDPTPTEFVRWRTESAELGYTSADAANFFSGRQIWIDHGNGISSRYLHLSSIDPAVQVGSTVERNQIIARVGNTGSPGMLTSEEEDAHLHFELRIGPGYLGQYLRPIEAREWLRRILR